LGRRVLNVAPVLAPRNEGNTASGQAKLAVKNEGGSTTGVEIALHVIVLR
jgi:hypothetical protein